MAANGNARSWSSGKKGTRSVQATVPRSVAPAGAIRETRSLNVSATNSGSITWQSKDGGPTPIQAVADAYRRLEDIQQTRPMYSYRADLSGPVVPGSSISLELRAQVDDLPIGRSFLIVDLVCDEKAVRFTAGATKPLVLGVHRDEWTDEVELVAG